MDMNLNKGGAPIGNTNNLRWTAASAQELIDDVLLYIKNNEKCMTMAEAFAANETYEAIVRYLRTKFKDGVEVDFTPIKKGMEILKARIINSALYNKTNAAMSIFLLKNNYGMKDRVDVTTDQNPMEKQITIFQIPDNGRGDSVLNEEGRLN